LAQGLPALRAAAPFVFALSNPLLPAHRPRRQDRLPQASLGGAVRSSGRHRLRPACTAMDRIAIVSAMHQELRALLPLLQDGRIEHEVLLVLGGIGKVAAATTTAVLLDGMGVRALLFTGVAGGLAADVHVGDVVIARTLLQHDMDASPLFPRYEVPLTGRSRFAIDATLSQALARGCARALQAPHAALAHYGIAAPRQHDGLVISGDRFVATAAESRALRSACPTHWPSRWKVPRWPRSTPTSSARSRCCERSPTAPTTTPMSTSAASSTKSRPSSRATSCAARWPASETPRPCRPLP
jgi:adenosylhomocysteine nucleosidase